MFKIDMEGQPTPEGLAMELKRIAEKIEQGYTSGYGPFWKIEEVEDDDE